MSYLTHGERRRRREVARRALRLVSWFAVGVVVSALALLLLSVLGEVLS